MIRLVPLAFTALATVLIASAAHAQTDPDKPTAFVVPFTAGAATDRLARAIGNAVTAQTGQPVVVDNKAGASGIIASHRVAEASADGHTVLLSTNTTPAADRHRFKKLPYDPVKDFEPVTALGRGGQFMMVNPASAASNVGEFVALAKREPGRYTFGSGSSSSRIAGELFQRMADVKLLHVPYKSNTPVVTDLLGGQIDMTITDRAKAAFDAPAGVELFTTSPQALGAFQASQAQEWGRIVKTAGIEAG